MWKSLINCLPKDDSSQFSVELLTIKYHSSISNPSCIVDVGCGAGNSIDFFRSLLPEVQWIGIDIEDSPEVMSRSRKDGIFLNFDGVNIPLPDRHADILFCKQVFEHVRYPDRLLLEMQRILKDDGMVFGQTSHLEPYHSFQYWNFTPWGFKKIIEDAGFLMYQIRPCIDGLTLVRRTYEGRPRNLNRFFNEESPFNFEIDKVSKDKKLSTAETLIKKLEICGQFCFILKKAVMPSNPLTANTVK